MCYVSCCVAETEAFKNAAFTCIVFWMFGNMSHNACVWDIYKRFYFSYTATKGDKDGHCLQRIVILPNEPSGFIVYRHKLVITQLI